MAINRRDLLRAGGASLIGLAGSLLAACGPSAPPAIQPTPAAAKPAAAPTQPAAATTSAAATQPGAAQTPGRQLIGKLEGPSIVTDAAQLPKKFSEAPALADLVKQGKLPPVEQRLPEEPL
ncbi:MAG: ABC transporter substrate-binding protein, partial [Chloroflexi bacterium]|nr:ABC transporter substrate-binding protein [Chloroflexota bacterium]